jgi:hypothetical protein
MHALQISSKLTAAADATAADGCLWRCGAAMLVLEEVNQLAAREQMFFTLEARVVEHSPSEQAEGAFVGRQLIR